MILAIDIGSNTTKCLLGQKISGGVKKICDSNISNRITEGDGRLIPSAARKIADCINSFVELANSFSEEYQVRVVATSALREAENKEAVIEEVKARTGFGIEVLSGEAEARLSYFGAMSDPTLVDIKNAAYFDLGGGSIEIVAGDSKKAENIFSLTLGAVRMSNKFNAFGAVDSQITDEICQYAMHAFQNKLGEICCIKNLVGAGGAVVAARLMKEELKLAGQANIISVADMEKMLAILAPLSAQERIHLYAIHDGRADIIPAAFAVIIALMKYLKVDSLVHTFYNIRYGIILSSE